MSSEARVKCQVSCVTAVCSVPISASGLSQISCQSLVVGHQSWGF
jgi:hypothetical protein